MRRFLRTDSILIAIVLFTAAFFVVVFLLRPPGQEVTRSIQGVEDLTYDEFLSVRSEYKELLAKENPRTALVRLREEIKRDERLLRSCHPLVHEIGHAAYKKYGNFGEAIQFQDEICNSGYMHGVIESHFDAGFDTTLVLKSICSGYEDGTFLGWECYHGAGHGAMYYSNNELPSALALCDLYDTSFERGSCANGVFMENFNTDQKVHFAPQLREDDPFYPCEEQELRHKPDCYFYAPTYYLHLTGDNYGGALMWCKNAEFGFKSICAQGVGSEAMKQNINQPLRVEGICESGSKKQEKPCIVGMVGLYINHYGSYKPAQEMCETVKDQHKDLCFDAVESYLKLFQ